VTAILASLLQVQAALLVLYLAVLEISSPLWLGAAAALTLLLLGCVCLFGDASR
jgi:hypothetical protein